MKCTDLKKSSCLGSSPVINAAFHHLRFDNYASVGMVHRPSWSAGNQYRPCLRN